MRQVHAGTRVDIYDQAYTLGSVGDSEADAAYVRQLAERVDAKMHQIARETRVVDSLRVAVLAAINLADENETLRARVERLERQTCERARALGRDLDRLLNRAG
jgi:cell division protein ZapA